MSRKRLLPIDEFQVIGMKEHPLTAINERQGTRPGLIDVVRHLQTGLRLRDVAVEQGVSDELADHFADDWLGDGWGWGDDPERETMIREAFIEALQQAYDTNTRAYTIVQSVPGLPEVQVVADTSDVQTTIILQFPARTLTPEVVRLRADNALLCSLLGPRPDATSREVVRSWLRKADDDGREDARR